MQTHRYSFFGQKTAMILQSGDWADPFLFLTFIKKRDGGSWEKLAEGKTVKLSLPEIVALRAAVTGEKPEWKTFHKSNGTGTPISARLESNKEDRGNFAFLISAGEYLRPINYPETAILEKLLEHVFEEKIAHATGSPKPAGEEPSGVEAATGATEANEGTKATEDPVQEPPAVEVNVPSPKLPMPVLDADATVADSLAKFNIPPLPRRLPGGVFPLTGRLKSVRSENGITTLFLKLANGTVEEIPATDIVGAGIHGAELDLVIKAIPSPHQLESSPDNMASTAKTTPKRGNVNKIPGAAPETTPKPSTEPAPVCATSVKMVTEKALLVTSAGGRELWVPKKALADATPAPAVPQEGAWQFAVKDWFAQKPDFQNWVKSP